MKRQSDLINMMRSFSLSEVKYFGRMSPLAKEELYRNY